MGNGVKNASAKGCTETKIPSWSLRCGRPLGVTKLSKDRSSSFVTECIKVREVFQGFVTVCGAVLYCL